MADETMSAEEAAEDESEQALLPKSFFAGKDLEVGSKCKIKVEGIYDDEVAVSYVKSKKKDGKKDNDSDDDDDDDKPRRRRDRDDTDSMREAMMSMEMMAQPAPGGSY